jgi:putative tricarboxylic transport membrane protein
VKVNDTIVGAGFVAAGAFVILRTLDFPRLDDGHPGPALFPQIVGGLMVAFGGVLAAQGLRAREALAGGWLRGRGLANALLALGMVVAYILVVDRVGFLPTAALLLFGLMWWLRVRPLVAAPVAVGLAVACYLLFGRLLLVPLPRGPVPW